MNNETKQCPYCGGEIMAQAKKCRHCGKWLTDDANKEPRTLDEKFEVDGHAVPHPISRDVNHSMQSRRMIVMMGGFAAIALIALLIWHFAGDSLFESVDSYVFRMYIGVYISNSLIANIVSYVIVLIICCVPGYFAISYIRKKLWLNGKAHKLRMGGLVSIAIIALIIWHFCGDPLFEVVDSYVCGLRIGKSVPHYFIANLISYLIVLLFCCLPGYYIIKHFSRQCGDKTKTENDHIIASYVSDID